MHHAVDTLCRNSHAGKDDWHVGIVPPWRSMGGGNREPVEIIDEAIRLEHHINVAGPGRVVVSQYRLDERCIRHPAIAKCAA